MGTYLWEEILCVEVFVESWLCVHALHGQPRVHKQQRKARHPVTQELSRHFPQAVTSLLGQVAVVMLLWRGIDEKVQ